AHSTGPPTTRLPVYTLWTAASFLAAGAGHRSGADPLVRGQPPGWPGATGGSRADHGVRPTLCVMLQPSQIQNLTARILSSPKSQHLLPDLFSLNFHLLFTSA